MAYGGDHDRRAFLLVTNWVFFAISLILVVLRLVSRRMLENKKWQIDDGLVVFALFVICIKTIWMTVNVSFGNGRHLLDLLAEDPVLVSKWARSAYGINALAFWTFTLPKLPVVALLVRLFEVRARHLGKILWSMLAVLIIWQIIMTVVTFVQCNPVEKNWNPAIPGTCWNPKIYLHMGYFSGSYSATLDFIYALYPTFQVSTLQVERSRKMVIAASFSLGIPAGIATLYKLTTIEALINQQDPTFATVPLDTWNCVECLALIVTATVPLIRPAVVVLYDKIKKTASNISGWGSTGSKGTSDNTGNDSGIGNVSIIHKLSSKNGYEAHASHDDIPLTDIEHEVV